MRHPLNSKFRLFRGRPDIITAGTWQIVPDNTPHYPDFHNFGWRKWTSDDRDSWPLLGEIEGRVESQAPFLTENPLPPARRIGSADCVRFGELFPLPVVARTLIGGYDSRCFAPGEATPLEVAINVNLVANQLPLARILQQTYTDPNAGAAALTALLGAGSSTSWVANSNSPYPGSIIGTVGTTTVILVSGTTTPQQWALQGLYGATGPRPVSLWSSISLWFAASTKMVERLEAHGASPTGPIVVVGHSYGGAVGANLVARLRIQHPGRDIQLLTFGMPQPGDDRLSAILNTVKMVNLSNDNDPVPALPPSGALASALVWLTPGGYFFGWDRWRSPGGRIGLRADGTRVVNPDPNQLYGVALSVIQQWLLGVPIASLIGHDLGTYIFRLGGPNPEYNDVIAGTLIEYGGGVVPAGYLLCNGQAVSRTGFPDLFLALGTIWGIGDGVNTFNVPDLRGRGSLGAGTGPGLSPRTLGDTLGEEGHQLTVAELAAHDHPVTDAGHAHDFSSGAVTATLAAGATVVPTGTPPGVQTTTNATGLTVDSRGGNAAHNTVHPVAVVTRLVKT